MICTVLRVAGLQDAQWDPFEESLTSFKDYNWLLKQAKDSPTPNGQWRIGLLMYCQAIEMTAVQENRVLAYTLHFRSTSPFPPNP